MRLLEVFYTPNGTQSRYWLDVAVCNPPPIVNERPAAAQLRSERLLQFAPHGVAYPAFG